MFQRITMIILILIIALGGGMYAYKELMPPPQETLQSTVYSTKEAVKANISVGVETIGRLEPSNHGGLRIPGNRGIDNIQYFIEEFFVEEGDAVKQGQIIAKLSSTDLESKILEKQEELKTKRKQLSEICQTPIEEVDTVNPAKGITITSPIDGVVTELEATEGSKLELGGMIARIVDSSRYIIKLKIFENELDKVFEGRKVIISFPDFSGEYEGTITKINNNRIPFQEGKEFAMTFAYDVSIEAENMGLVSRGMDVRVAVKNDKGKLDGFYNRGIVDKFIKEDKIMNTSVEAVITDIHVNDMQNVIKGDPIITLSSVDVQDLLQEKLDTIRKLNNEVNDLSSKIGQLEVKAPMDGIVAHFHINVGESVGPGDWFGSLYTVSDMRMWTEIDDIDVVNVNQGAVAKVTVDALSNMTYEGTVENVSTMGEQVNGVSKFNIEIKVEGSDQLRPGMQAKAYIDAGSAENVLTIPLEAVFEEDGKTMVEILQKDNTTKVIPVKLGLMNDQIAEVISGLTEGDKVVTGSSADLLPSQHIKSNNGLVPDKEENSDNQEKENAKE